MAKYVCNPVVVDAFEIIEITKSIIERSPNGKREISVKLEDGRIYECTPEMTSRMLPAVGDYLVRAADGYEYLNPKDVFKGKYSAGVVRYQDLVIGGINFGFAVDALKAGKKVARIGWNASGQYVYYVPANSYPAQTDAARQQFGDLVPYRAYLALKTAQNDVATWVPTVSDVLAEDWQIVD